MSCQLDRTQKKRIVHSFSRAVPTYRARATVQRDVARVLVSYLSRYCHKLSSIIEFGAGTGLLSDMVIDRFATAHVTLIDITPAMVELLRQRYRSRASIDCVVADMSDFSSSLSYDLVLSSFTLHWGRDVGEILSHWSSLLSEKGVIAFSIPLKGSCGSLHDEYNFSEEELFLSSETLECLFPKDMTLIVRKICSFSEVFDSPLHCLRALREIGGAVPFHRLGKYFSSLLRLRRWEKKSFICPWNVGFYMLQKGSA